MHNFPLKLILFTCMCLDTDDGQECYKGDVCDAYLNDYIFLIYTRKDNLKLVDIFSINVLLKAAIRSHYRHRDIRNCMYTNLLSVVKQ